MKPPEEGKPRCIHPLGNFGQPCGRLESDPLHSENRHFNLAAHRFWWPDIPSTQPLPAPPCVGYPTCDGDLPGEAHEPECPAPGETTQLGTCDAGGGPHKKDWYGPCRNWRPISASSPSVEPAPTESLDSIKLRIAVREMKALRKLLAAKDELLMAYGLGSHTRADVALSNIASAKQELEDFSARRNFMSEPSVEMRERFEKWAKKHFHRMEEPLLHDRGDGSTYFYTRVRLAWEGWQAGAASQGEDVHVLSNLLAVIHRDGGHYQAEHGTRKAGEDAEKIVIALRAALPAAPPKEA